MHLTRSVDRRARCRSVDEQPEPALELLLEALLVQDPLTTSSSNRIPDMVNIPAGSHAHNALELSGEVRLVVEARLRGYHCDRQALPEERLGTPHAHLRYARARRLTYRPT